MLLGQMHQESCGCNDTLSFYVDVLTPCRSVELHIGILCTSLPVIAPLGKRIASTTYFKDQYQSALSLIRGTRKRSSGGSRSGDQNFHPRSEDKNYIELSEPEIGKGFGN